jgi:hypothetical protein
MRTIDGRTKRMIGGLIALVAFVAGPLPKGFAQEDSQTVYFGEADSKTDQVITLNVTPCQNTKTLLTISPYKITGSGRASCSGGKQYTRITVQESKPDPRPDPKPHDLIENTADKKTDKKKDGDAKPKPEIADKDRTDN